MTDNSELRNDPEADEVVQAVEDRVLSWHAGAEAGTVRSELEKALQEAGASMPEEWIASTAERISKADPAQKGGAPEPG